MLAQLSEASPAAETMIKVMPPSPCHLILTTGQQAAILLKRRATVHPAAPPVCDARLQEARLKLSEQQPQHPLTPAAGAADNASAAVCEGVWQLCVKMCGSCV